MTGSTRKPTVHLSLVKERAQGRTGKFLSLEALSPEQSELIKQYQKMVAPGGVLVGVVVGGAAWDLRPLILQRGVMTITRMFSPSLRGSAAMSDIFKSYVFKIEQLFPGVQQLVCGSSEGYAWVTRRYFNQLLTDPNLILPLQDRITLIGGLLEDLQLLHGANLVHGHVCPSNIAFENGKFILLDHGLQIHDPELLRPETLAPELSQGIAARENASPATDLYGCGLVTKQLLGAALGTEYGNLIEVLLLNDPKLRPSLAEIKKHFIGESSNKESLTDSGDLKINSQKLASKATVTGESKVALKTDFHLSKYTLPLIGTAAIVGALYFARPYLSRPSDLDDKVEKYWTSNQPTLMQQVVVAGLGGNSTILHFLADSAQEAVTHPSVQRNLFVTALNPLWQDELSDTDLKALVTLGMGNLVPAQYREVPDLSKLHPGVVFALVSQMAIEDEFESFAKVTLKQFGRLPEPYSGAFLALDKLGVEDLSSEVSQSLCHILAGDISTKVIQHFISDSDKPEAIAAKIELLMPLLDLMEGNDQKLMSALSTSGRLGGLFSWFDKDLIDRWTTTPPRTKLLLLTGVFPQEKLSIEQLVDLLRFPRSNVRERAERQLETLLSASLKPVLSVLAQPDCALTRAQMVLLVSALQVEKASVVPYLIRWFDTSPDALAVTKVLGAWRSSQSVDYFAISAARYLIDKKVKTPIAELSQLASHPEPLVRAYAYSNISSASSEGRKILELAYEVETDSRLKGELAERLHPDE